MSKKEWTLTEALKLYDKRELIIIINDLVEIFTPNADLKWKAHEYLYQIIVLRDPNVNIDWEKS